MVFEPRLRLAGFEPRLRLQGLNPGLGSQFFEPRLARLKLGVFELMDNIIYQ